MINQFEPNVEESFVTKISNRKKRKPKNPLKYNMSLDEWQKTAKRLIYENQLVIVTGDAGSGKSLTCAITSLDLFFKREVEQILVTRAAIETGKSLGYLPGELKDKFGPYLEAFMENVQKSIPATKLKNIIDKKAINALPVQYIRGKTVDDILIVEETQNFSKHEILAILTRLGKKGRIVFNGDLKQTDLKHPGDSNGLEYLIKLSNSIKEIKHIHLNSQHRSDLVGKIIDYEYNKS